MAKRYHLVTTKDQMTDLFKQMLDHGHVAIDVRTDGPDPMTSKLVGLGISPAPKKSYYIPLAHDDAPGLSFENDVKPWIEHVCMETWITTVFFDTVNALIVLSRYGIEVDPGMIYDVLIVQPFNPVDYHFEWTDDWYTWDADEARTAALKARNAKATELRKSLKGTGKTVKCFSMRNQLISRGGIGSGHPHIELVTNIYGVNVL